MSYKVQIDDFDRDQWEYYAGYFADYSIYQTWPYQQNRAQRDRQQISRAFVTDDMGEIVTMCQIRIKHIKPIGLKVGYIQRGPLLLDMDGKIRCSSRALYALRQAYVGTSVDVLSVVPNICRDHAGEQAIEMLCAAGFEPSNSAGPYRTFRVHVGDDEEEIRKRLRKSFRRDLKKAENSGIEIRQGEDEQFFDILDALYADSLRRKRFKGLDPQEFSEPQRSLSDRDKMTIIVARSEGEPVSVVLTSNLGDTAIVLLAAANECGLKCGSSYVTWYQGAIAAMRAGMKWCDLGGVDPENNPNVYQFKSRMGGEEVFHIGSFEAHTGSAVRNVWHAAEKIYRAVKR